MSQNAIASAVTMKFLISVDYPQPSFFDPDSNFFLPGLTPPNPNLWSGMFCCVPYCLHCGILGRSLSILCGSAVYGFLCCCVYAKPGLMARLTRNLDKQRGFVNGALAVVCESLRGNSVFTARLVGTGNMVLVHPMEENGEIFLPCCYGYATTIRRAQGASLTCGAV